MLWLLTVQAAWSQTSAFGGERQTQAIIIALTVIVALAVGLWLYELSQRSSRVRFKGTAETVRAPQQAAARSGTTVNPSALTPAILEEVRALPGSDRQREQVAGSVSRLVAKTVDAAVGTATQELSERYQKIAQEHQRNESALQQKYKATLTEKKQTAAVLASIAEGLVVVNNKGEVIMMNPAATRLLGENSKEAAGIGRPLMEQLGEQGLVSMIGNSKDATDEREIIVNSKQEQTKRVVRASNAMITDENGNTVGMVAVLSDVTKQRQLDQMKADFVSKVSHELRTPIVTMQHALAILSDQVAGQMSEEQLKFVNLTRRNLERLNYLINDLLDLSKLEAKKMPLRLQAGSAASVIQQACESLAPWANSKAISLRPRCPDDLPNALFDSARIHQVLMNLIGNAIKFTPKQGRVIIEARRAEGEEALEISVSDTGPGIPKEDLPKLFSKFQQVGPRPSSDITGTGLGLAISKEIIELHKGRIWADPNANEGARFVFTLPLAPAAAQQGT